MTRAPSLAAALSFGLGLAVAGGAWADGLRLRTAYTSSAAWNRASSLDAFLGYSGQTSGAGSLRLMWDKGFGDFRVEIHSNTAFAQGDFLGYATAIAPFYPTPLPATLFDLTRTWSVNGSTLATNTIDRLNVTYSAPHFVLKLGRQAITWGTGLAFHPGDIVAPFAPNATDTAYKPGADMVYSQILFDSGADIQAVWVPRGTTLGGAIDFSSSTFALRGQTALGSLEAALMLARDRGDPAVGLSLSGALGGASWNAEVTTYDISGSLVPSWTLNIMNFATLAGRNISYYGEFYHNGFGAEASTPLDSLPASLTKRMAAGQVFLPGRDFLALGGTMAIDPDLSLGASAIVNVNDRSALAGLSINYTLGDNTNLVFNYFQPFGAEGTEFDGRETSSGSGIFSAAPRAASLQLVHFF